MRTITVGFSRPSTWKPFAWMIMAAYRTNYDHVYIKLHTDSYQRDIIYQASSVMVNFMSPVIFQAKNVIVEEYPIQISDENYVKLMQFCIDNAGKPYSLLEVLGFACMVIAGWFGKKISNPFQESTSQFVCSVLGDYILSNFTDEAVPQDFESVDPKTLRDVLAAQKKT